MQHHVIHQMTKKDCLTDSEAAAAAETGRLRHAHTLASVEFTLT